MKIIFTKGLIILVNQFMVIPVEILIYKYNSILTLVAHLMVNYYFSVFFFFGCYFVTNDDDDDDEGVLDFTNSENFHLAYIISLPSSIGFGSNSLKN